MIVLSHLLRIFPGYIIGRSKVAFQKPLSTDIIIVFLKLFIMGKLDRFNEQGMEILVRLAYHTNILLPTN